MSSQSSESAQGHELPLRPAAHRTLECVPCGRIDCAGELCRGCFSGSHCPPVPFEQHVGLPGASFLFSADSASRRQLFRYEARTGCLCHY